MAYAGRALILRTMSVTKKRAIFPFPITFSTQSDDCIPMCPYFDIMSIPASGTIINFFSDLLSVLWHDAVFIEFQASKGDIG